MHDKLQLVILILQLSDGIKRKGKLKFAAH